MSVFPWPPVPARTGEPHVKVTHVLPLGSGTCRRRQRHGGQSVYCRQKEILAASGAHEGRDAGQAFAGRDGARDREEAGSVIVAEQWVLLVIEVREAPVVHPDALDKLE